MMDINNAKDILSRWLPQLTKEEKDRINQYFNMINEGKYFRSLITNYLRLIFSYSNPLINKIIDGDPEYLVSGIMFFYWKIVFICIFPNWGNHIENIILYNILYLLVDNYIDDCKHLDIRSKELALYQMEILVNDPHKYLTMNFVDPILPYIAQIYIKLLDNCPTCREYMIKLYNLEIKGYIIQKSNVHDEETYYNIALEKGGFTMVVLASIIQYISDQQFDELIAKSYHIGTIMQLIDDCLDAHDDKQNGINTIATYHLDKYGNLDKLWYDIVDKIYNIDPAFNIFKIIYSVFATYIPIRFPHHFDPNIVETIYDVNIFEFNASCLLSSYINIEKSLLIP